MANRNEPLLHICYAPADRGWVHGRMVRELGLRDGQYRTREDDRLGDLQLEAIEKAVDECRFTVLIASSAARWDRLAQFAAALAQHAQLEGDSPRLIIVARDFAPLSDSERTRLPLHQRALVGLDCSDDEHAAAALARLRTLLALDEPTEDRPPCPYPGLARFTAANRDLLFGRNRDKSALLQRIRGACHTRILVVGPSGSGKSSLVHAAVLPELSASEHVVRVVQRGGNLATALRTTIDALEVPALGPVLDHYRDAIRDATDVQVEQARTGLRTTNLPDARRRVVVLDPLEEIFVEHDAASCETLFALLAGLWSLPWCTVILCMRADFYGALMVERCWRELEDSQYSVAPLDENGLRAAIIEPARHAGVHIDAALVERLIRGIDRDRSSVALPLLQVALKELWAHLRWRYLTVVDYNRIVNHDQRGLAAVLAVHAKAVMQALTSPGDQPVAQRILLDLVHFGEGRPHTRRRRTLEDLRRSGDKPDQLERVLERLVEGRLVTIGDGDRPAALSDARPVDLAHDALITGWDELAAWIKDRQGELLKYRRLEAWAREWDDSGRTRPLLDEGDMAEAQAWKDSPGGKALGVSQRLLDLIAASAAEHARARSEKEAMITRLLDEQHKTRASIAAAVRVGNEILFQVDAKLRSIAGVSPVREALISRSRSLLGQLRALGGLEADAERTEMATKAAQANIALERGRLDNAHRLFREIHEHAQWRVTAEPSSTDCQCDLAASYDKLGDVALSAGRAITARDWFEKALAVREALVAADPDNTDWQGDLAGSCAKLGDVALTASRLDDARRYFGKALGIDEALATTDSAKTGRRRGVSAPCRKLGAVALASGKLDDARAWFDKAHAVDTALVRSDRSRRAWQSDLSCSCDDLGTVAASTGMLDHAKDWFHKALVIREALATGGPETTAAQHHLSASYRRLGGLAVSAGNLADARDWFSNALVIAAACASNDPDDTLWQQDLSASYIKLGDVAFAERKVDEAWDWFDKALAVDVALTNADPTNTIWQYELSVCHVKLGEASGSAGDFNDAHAWFDKALAVRDALAATDSGNITWQRELSVSYIKLGDLAVSAENLNDARAWFDKAAVVCKVVCAADPSNTTWQREQLVACVKSGDAAVTAGDLRDAQAWFDRALDVTLAINQPTSSEWQRELAGIHDRLGNVASSLGHGINADTWFTKALAVREAMVAAQPTSTAWQRQLSASYIKLGTVAMSASRPRDARKWFHKALAIRAPLAEADRANTVCQHELWVTFDSLGSASMSAGKRRDAHAWFLKALSTAQVLAAVDSANTTWQRDLSISLERLGDIAVAARKDDDAHYWFDKALAIAKDLAVAHPTNPVWQRDLCIALVQIVPVARNQKEARRHLEDARAIYKQLLQSGSFKHDAKFAQLGDLLGEIGEIRTLAAY